MRTRALARLALVSWVALGALLVTVHVGHWSGTPPRLRSQTFRTVAATVPVADETRPHSHVDPLPPGVDLADPTDTVSLLDKAGAVRAALDAGDQPVSPGATAPIGTPGIRTIVSHVVPSCSGTGTDGKRVQVLYVHETTTASRLDQVLPVLRNEVANVDDVFAVSAQQTGGDRRVRWVHDADCLPVIQDVTVPAGALGPSFTTTVGALKALGYTDKNRKYLAFADANQFCGIGTLFDDTRLLGNQNDGYAASYSRVDANCWSTSHSVAAHELTHNLGGVQPGAPHATTNGHCWDESDLMCYDDGSGVPMKQVCDLAQEALLDCNHDDYFNTSPAAGSFLASSWNVASSSFLDAQPILTAPPVAPTPVVPPATDAPAVTPPPGTATPDPVKVRVTTRLDAAAARHRAAATLRTSAGIRVGGVRLVLQRRPAGSARWTPTARPRTDRAGHVSVAVSARRGVRWRWVYPGDGDRRAAVSRVFAVRR